jgi:hypothetical protein
MSAAWVAREFYAPIIPIVMELHGQGLSLRAIGRDLDQRGIKPRYGYQAGWNAAQVRRVLAEDRQPRSLRLNRDIPYLVQQRRLWVNRRRRRRDSIS